MGETYKKRDRKKDGERQTDTETVHIYFVLKWIEMSFRVQGFIYLFRNGVMFVIKILF